MLESSQQGKAPNPMMVVVGVSAGRALLLGRRCTCPMAYGLSQHFTGSRHCCGRHSYTLIVVVKCTSALAVTLTRKRTGLLRAELSPRLPFIAVDPNGSCSLEPSEVLHSCWV